MLIARGGPGWNRAMIVLFATRLAGARGGMVGALLVFSPVRDRASLRSRHVRHPLTRTGWCVFAAFTVLLASCSETRRSGTEPQQEDAQTPALDASDAAASADASPLASEDVPDAGDRADSGVPQAAIPEQRGALCARPADDAVRDLLCKGELPAITGLRVLAAGLKLSVLKPDTSEASAAAIEIDPFASINTAVFLGLSTALSGQLVSPINPRAILFNPQTFLAFQRGVQKVEIATRDRNEPRFNFYLLSFKQACNERSGGCLPGDLYTLSIERDWTAISLEDDEDLKNTPSDCRLCHQRGPGPATLLMRELRAPWTHFFGLGSGVQDYDAGSGAPGTDLARDYALAKGSESYAGIPAAFMSHTAGATLQLSVDNAQPIEFDAPSIEAELEAKTARGEPRRSATWDQAFAAFKRGDQLALPHFEPRPTDPGKQAALSAAYTRYLRGEISAQALPDLADIFPDDARVRAEIGLQTEPDATPAETLIQACGPCHNDVLDQTISRARFNVALARMSRAELDLAITRIMLPVGDPAVMPPKGMRQIDPAAKQKLSDYLKQDQRPGGDDALLEGAAKVGMAKPRANYPRL
jgi:hypothetical protein